VDTPGDDHPEGAARENRMSNILDSLIPCGCLAIGMIVGWLSGGLLGENGLSWLAMGIGGACFGGLGWYLRLTYRPHVGDRGGALRIVLLLFFIGVYGYVADRVGGRGLVFVAVTIVPIVVYFTFATLYASIRFVRRFASTRVR
jgi:hypothetical protein